MVGALATRLAGSSDVFAGEKKTRSVNFIAAHDGMTLGDIVAYERKHNEANGEENRDGHVDNLSWNNGVEGFSNDAGIQKRRKRDVRALLATLFASRGTIMLTAGDEFGRTQHGNNNAYAQDNETTWLDWDGRDLSLEDFAMSLAAMRKAVPALGETGFLTGEPLPACDAPDVAWLTESGAPLDEADWTNSGRRRLVMVLGGECRLAVAFNGDNRACVFALPAREGYRWEPALEAPGGAGDLSQPVPGRTVTWMIEREADVQ
jgi:glycogen operon protein